MKETGLSGGLRAVSSAVLAYLMLRPVSNGAILYPARAAA